ncbi:hypothetical protein GGS23DRAFT_617058 [Durotheca rogersii]|uniref:uncharacterized protein n=1 Tax=Durotheca rogersii TaxID=419775 RepID=UPI00221F15E9|nr:uncharacterized protein GGS23DRAFT_617058 [Durotheca rogersii]KAI5865946.1 hypothetical protein GGS23DRAFT_617058 [Durotheca rogersii]
MTSIRDLLSPTSQASPERVEPRGRDGGATEEAGEAGETTATAARTTYFVVEFILDLVCPYCYLGLKSLDAAIETYRARHPAAVFEVTCSPFLLDPQAARSAYDKATYLARGRVHTAAQLAALGRGAGIAFAWAGRTGSTRDAHKVLRLALEGGSGGSGAPSTARSTAFAGRGRGGGAEAPGRGPALQLRLLRALLRAHHELGADISAREWLVGAAAAAAPGIPPAEVRRVVYGEHAAAGQREDQPPDEWDRALDGLCADVRARRCSTAGADAEPAIRAVPTLVVNERYVIGGWQTADRLVFVPKT